MNKYKKELDNVCKHLSKPIKLVALQELVELRTPKKPIYNEFDETLCGCCVEECIEYPDSYCRECGQALDWSE